MTYVPPTPADFKTRYPSFVDVPDATVQAVLNEAETRVTDRWREVDRLPAVMLYTAHVLTLEGLGTGTESEVAGTDGFKVIRSGSLTLERFDNGSITSNSSQLRSTSFGRRFYELLRLNFPAILNV